VSAISAELNGLLRGGAVRTRVPARSSSRRAAGRALSVGLIAMGDVWAVAVAALIARPGASAAAGYGGALAVVLVAARAYRPGMNLQALMETPAHVARAAIALLLLGLVAVVVSGSTEGVDRSADLVVMAAITAVLLPVGRAATYTSVRWLRRRRVVRDPVLVVGADEVGRAVARTLDINGEHGLRPVGFVDDVDPAGAPAPLLGELGSLEHVLVEQDVRRIIVAFGDHREGDLVRVLRTALRRDVDVYVVPRLHAMALDAPAWRVEMIACTPLHRLRPAAPNLRAWRAKRVFDVVVAGTVLVLLSPFLAALAVAVKVTDPGPVLFRQRRIGQHGRTFELLKFRSLRVNDDADVRWSVVGDERQTPLGRWMRRFSVDELPQLWNVVRGDMSLIGPRPERPHFVREFTAAVDGYEDRHRLPVGLTGWAQINGLRGDTSIEDRARYDNHYIDHWSLLRDLAILGATVAAVLRDARRKPSA
jgi:exopolysaccharide biosynthesis polyprenyl glycosylphosphotransferase